MRRDVSATPFTPHLCVLSDEQATLLMVLADTSRWRWYSFNFIQGLFGGRTLLLLKNSGSLTVVFRDPP